MKSCKGDNMVSCWHQWTEWVLELCPICMVVSKLRLSIINRMVWEVYDKANETVLS